MSIDFEAALEESIAAVRPQILAIEAIQSQFYGSKIVRRTNKNLIVRFGTRGQATQFGGTCQFDGWSVQISKGLNSTQYYALVYFNYPY